MLEQILAKSNPETTLTDHTNRAINIWFLNKKRWGKILDVNDDFWFRSYLSVLFHDSGKITDNFQDVIKTETCDFDNENIRHEFVSTAVLLANEAKYYQDSPLSLYAVMSHHKPLTDELFSDDIYKKLRLNPETLTEFIDYAKKEVSNSFGKDFETHTQLPEFISKANLQTLYSFVFVHFFKENTATLTSADRKEYIYYKALLQISDWVGSGNGKMPKRLIFDYNDLEHAIVKKLQNDKEYQIACNFKWRTFQRESLLKSNVISIAPTGSGKTEAALIWASQKKDNSKIIYALPTRVTSNAIYQRLTSYFGKDNVAVVHSSARFFRKEIDGDYTGFAYLYDKTFFKNISVCTIDQLLTQGFNLGFWELKTFHCLNARVIIDEIHLYAPYTLGLIISTIRYLKEEFGAEFYIMSATMPKKLKKLLSKTLSAENGQLRVIEDKELLNKSRNIFEVRNNLIDKIEIEVIEQIEIGKKVLIVVNTVDEAIRLYKKFEAYTNNIICYHSRFIQKDRVRKENDILRKEQQNEGLLLIATQVVEVSLDVDFDILFTENAPVDAIIQRAGRVNRKREKEYTKVIVFKETEITAKWVYDEPNILENTFIEIQKKHGKRLIERELNAMVNRVYADLDIENNEHFKKGLNSYCNIQKNNHFIKDNLSKDEVYTREGLDTINVIPSCFEEEIIDAPIEEKTKYELSVRRSKQFSNQIYHDSKDNFKFIDAYYDYECGLQFIKQKSFVNE